MKLSVINIINSVIIHSNNVIFNVVQVQNEANQILVWNVRQTVLIITLETWNLVLRICEIKFLKHFVHDFFKILIFCNYKKWVFFNPIPNHAHIFYPIFCCVIFSEHF